jgi:hypothetical protein
MLQALLLIAALAAMFSLVPLATWAATGRWRDAWRAAKGYAFALAIMGGVAGFLAAAALLSAP